MGNSLYDSLYTICNRSGQSLLEFHAVLLHEPKNIAAHAQRYGTVLASPCSKLHAHFSYFGHLLWLAFYLTVYKSRPSP